MFTNSNFYFGALIMYERVLILIDMEGVGGVVGEPYHGLSKGSEQWKIAVEQGIKEVNAAAEALFAKGVKKIGVWDNHGGSPNMDPSLLDPRITYIIPDPADPRLSFAKNEYDCVCFFGYHAMEGTLGGVLAHTMSSVSVQYYKLNGKYIGEVDMDSYIAAEHGIPSVFFAAGDIACSQAKRILPHLMTVTTKKEISRNEAIFRDNESLLADIKEQISYAVEVNAEAIKLTFPAKFEKSFKRVEDGAKYLSRLKARGISCNHPEDEILGRDAHTVVSTVNNMSEFIICI